MADVYVNALTTISTEPTTTDSLVAVNRNTNEGKIIDYNLLADVILDKITSKQFSGLDTTSKLLVGAINELDSDVSSLNSRLEIKRATYTGTTSASGTFSGAFGDFNMSGGTILLGAHIQRDSYYVYREVQITNYGNAGVGITCYQGTTPANMTEIANSSVTLTLYYI